MKKLIPFVFALSLVGCGDCNGDTPETTADLNATATRTDTLTICSFNIQFVGHFTKKDNTALANLLKDYDIVVIQELIAPPISGNYPDGTSFSADPEAAAFLQAMTNQGFQYVQSEEDTGPGTQNHLSTTATEWWITFYKSNKVATATDLPSGFLAADRSDNPDFERVPYAFAFRTPDNKLDFVLISVHLAPGAAENDRRKEELDAIASWIDANDQTEKDFIILGDMNIENSVELANATPTGYLSLNDECRKTNTAAGSQKPYDHAMYNTTHTATDLDIQYDLAVVDLIEAMRNSWTSSDPYPGDPYDHNLFRQYYSDHHPVVFKMVVRGGDDD